MKTIVDVCEAHWAAWSGDCSGFLKAVSRDVGLPLVGQANQIIDAISKPGWEDLGHDSKKAVLRASSRCLVIAGIKEDPNGHVVVIVPGRANPWPHAYWGMLDGVGQKNAPISRAFFGYQLPDVRFYSQSIPTPIAII
jgi:hypothetical protein